MNDTMIKRDNPLDYVYNCKITPCNIRNNELEKDSHEFTVGSTDASDTTLSIHYFRNVAFAQEAKEEASPPTQTQIFVHSLGSGGKEGVY